MDTTYRVVLDLSTTGSLGENVGAAVAKVGGLADKLGHAHEKTELLEFSLHKVGHAAERVGHVVEGLADTFIHIGASMAAATVGGLFAAATYGAMHLNTELEQTQISMGAIFQAQGFARTFEQGFSQAGEQLQKMKQDVKTLPGDLGQLSDIMKMIATPGAAGGLDPDQIRKAAGKTMLVATILGVQQDMAAREMAMLYAGRAGSHNILGGRLGLIGENAQRFNKEDPHERAKEIEVLLSKYQGATDRFAQSFIANWTTLKDNVKYGFLANATAPLFDRIKVTIAEINTWFDHNGEKVDYWTRLFSTHFASGWTMVTDEAKKFMPTLEHLGHVFFQLWDDAVAKAHELEPILGKIAAFFDKLEAKDIEDAAKDVLVAKAAGKGMQWAGEGIGMGVGGLQGYNALQGILARRAAAGAAETAAGAAAGSEGVGALAAGGLGVAFFTAAASIELLAIAIPGYILAIKDFTQTVHRTTEKTGEEVKADLVIKSQEEAKGAIDHLGVSMDSSTASALLLKGALENLFVKIDHLLPTVVPDLPPSPGQDNFTPAHLHNALPAIIENLKSQKVTGGGMNIGKIEIVVKGNDDPSRVARLIGKHLQQLARNPTKSTHVTDWSE